VLTRTRTRLRERSFAAMAARLADLLAAKAPESRQLIIRDSGRTIVLPWTDIVWIEAEDYCARIHLRDRTVLVRDSRDRSGAVLAFTSAQWRDLMTRIRHGR